MNNYIKILPENPHFTQNGLKGYKYNIETERLGLYIEIKDLISMFMIMKVHTFIMY